MDKPNNMADTPDGESTRHTMSIDMRWPHEEIGLIFGGFLAAILLTGCGIGNMGGGSSGSAGVSNEPFLTDLTLSTGQLAPSFNQNTTAYTATVPYLSPTTTVTATPKDPTATVTVNGTNQTFSVNLAEGDNPVKVQVTNIGGEFKVYTVTVTRQSAATFAQQAYVKASNTDSEDEFGYSVALSGDRLAVGAPSESSNATGINSGGQNDNSFQDAGAVYVFVRSGITWSQDAYIKPFNTDKHDKFGSSVALSGDTLAVGAPFEDSNAIGINSGGQNDNSFPDAGAVYVFVRSSGAWTQQAYIKGSNTSSSDHFGSSISLDRDTLVVGAPATGKVYMFHRSNTTWTQQGYVNAPGIGFGSSVAVSGDTLAVGAPFDSSNAKGINGDQSDTSAQNAGAVYTFTRKGGLWSQDAYIKPFNTDAEDKFGTSVALSADTLAVGAPFEDSNARGINPGGENNNTASEAGAVYVFTRDSSGWSQQTYIKASNSLSGDKFGWSLALVGEVLAVGAYTSNSTSGNDGAAYVFIESNGTWSEQGYLKAFNTDPQDWFGYSVALNGGTLAVGAIQEDSGLTGIDQYPLDNSALDSGAVYVFQ
jgi:hypothetical protein